MNKVILIGRVGKDAENRAVGGKTVTNFSLATSESYKKDGEWQDKTTWHNIVFWDSKGAQTVKKGDLVGVEGKIQHEEYTKDGQTRTATKINCDRLHIFQRKDRAEGEARTPRQMPMDDASDDLPF